MSPDLRGGAAVNYSSAGKIGLQFSRRFWEEDDGIFGGITRTDQEITQTVDEEKSLPVWFRGRQIVNFRADLVVASVVIVEVKTRPAIDSFNKAQVLHYLKATDLEVGLLLNFGRRPEFHRVVYEQSRKTPRLPAPVQTEDGIKAPVQSETAAESS